MIDDPRDNFFGDGGIDDPCNHFLVILGLMISWSNFGDPVFFDYTDDLIENFWDLNNCFSKRTFMELNVSFFYGFVDSDNSDQNFVFSQHL